MKASIGVAADALVYGVANTLPAESVKKGFLLQTCSDMAEVSHVWESRDERQVRLVTARHSILVGVAQPVLIASKNGFEWMTASLLRPGTSVVIVEPRDYTRTDMWIHRLHLLLGVGLIARILRFNVVTDRPGTWTRHYKFESLSGVSLSNHNGPFRGDLIQLEIEPNSGGHFLANGFVLRHIGT